jgi:hypothetical protein
VAQVAKRSFVTKPGTRVFILVLAIENEQLQFLFRMVDKEVVLAPLRLALEVESVPVKAVFIGGPV